MRDELRLGAYEFVAPKSYQSREPLLPTYAFVIDCSFTSVQSGLFQ